MPLQMSTKFPGGDGKNTKNQKSPYLNDVMEKIEKCFRM